MTFGYWGRLLWRTGQRKIIDQLNISQEGPQSAAWWIHPVPKHRSTQLWNTASSWLKSHQHYRQKLALLTSQEKLLHSVRKLKLRHKQPMSVHYSSTAIGRLYQRVRRSLASHQLRLINARWLFSTDDWKQTQQTSKNSYTRHTQQSAANCSVSVKLQCI